ncbi:MAG: hypothetical protein Q4A21_00145 [bacterium]|nr:hypothetical protein [bacterium]
MFHSFEEIFRKEKALRKSEISFSKCKTNLIIAYFTQKVNRRRFL